MAKLLNTIHPGVRLALRPLDPGETGLPRAVGLRLYESMLRAARADVEIICRSHPVGEGVNLSCSAADLEATHIAARAEARFPVTRATAPYRIALAEIARRLAARAPAVGPVEGVMPSATPCIAGSQSDTARHRTTLTLGLDLKGRVVTVDAMHVQHDTARCVVESCGAHYVMTAVKTNQPNLLLDLQGLDWERLEVRTTEHRTANKGHGRIENRVHHVRDVSCHEDRSRVRTGHLPRNLACLNNLAISIARIQSRFEFLPQAHRHYARRPQDAVRQLLEPPKR